MKLWKIVLCAMAFAVFASCGIQKTPPPLSSGLWLDVPSTVKIDTLSYTRLNWKMRNSFTFRWNYAKYASNQPFSFYSSASFARFGIRLIHLTCIGIDITFGTTGLLAFHILTIIIKCQDTICMNSLVM